MRLIFPLLFILLLFPGCKKNAEKEARKRDLRALMHGTTADPDISAAMEKARETSGEFLAALKNPKPNQRQFLVRKSFPSKTAPQQILWVNNVTFDGALLHGKVDDNTIEAGSGIPTDGKVSFPPGEICDWMFNEEGKAVGGFTLRALKDKMTPKEWEAIERQISFKE